MKRKILISLGVVAGVLTGVSALGAFEAHVINVKAKIENALAVSPLEIDFGTVFPQEYLTYNFDVRLSESFLEEDRVDDIQYVIKQKPKPRTPDDLVYCHEAQPPYPEDPTNDFYTHCYPDLGPYLSKQPEEGEDGDVGVMAFHDARTAIAEGYLSKEDGDIADRWVVDLPVPCFGTLGDTCDQGWPAFFALHSGQLESAAWGWTLPKAMEHEVFGADLWIEVVGISVNYIDRVDIGNPADEAGHLEMVGDDWSYVGSQTCTPSAECLKPGGYGGYDPGDLSHDFRGLMGAPTGCEDTVPGSAPAKFRLDVGMSDNPKKLVLRHLDGSQDDSFDVYANGDLIGHYEFSGNTNEYWTTTEYPIPDEHQSIVEFELVATDPDTPWCNSGWGQVMINWAEVRETP